MRIGIVAGEASGDLLGAGLIREIRKRHPEVRFEGVAGPAMQAEGCTAIENSEALAVMGLIEPIREIPRLLRLRNHLVSRWRQDPPDVVVGIDSPDFNLGLELKLRKLGIRTVQYVSPQVWAWRQGRIRKIRESVDKVLCLLPFEKKFYDDHGVAADFVGHPMAERISAEPNSVAARDALGLTADKVIAVLPGSRGSEVQRLGPIFAETCSLIVRSTDAADLSFVAPMATDKLKQLFREHLRAHHLEERVKLLDGDSETAITAADVALVASGTATLETALLATPLVAAYKLSALSYFIVKFFRLFQAPHVTLPNLLTGEPLVPEFIQQDATPNALHIAVLELLHDDARCARIATEFSRLRSQLARGADARSAQAVLQLIEQGGAG